MEKKKVIVCKTRCEELHWAKSWLEEESRKAGLGDFFHPDIFREDQRSGYEDFDIGYVSQGLHIVVCEKGAYAGKVANLIAGALGDDDSAWKLAKEIAELKMDVNKAYIYTYDENGLHIQVDDKPAWREKTNKILNVFGASLK